MRRRFALIGAARMIFAGCALGAAMPVAADSSVPPAEWANRQLPDRRAEAKAKSLMEEIRCLVCQGQSVADSDSDLAGDMRNLIRTRISAGDSPEKVRAWLVERYGTWISYRPPSAPIGWPLWILPFALLIIGALMLRKRVRWGRRS